MTFSKTCQEKPVLWLGVAKLVTAGGQSAAGGKSPNMRPSRSKHDCKPEIDP